MSSNPYCNYLCVTDFGATGNGTTDDTSSIQTAINDCISAGAVLFFPPGQYRITSTLLINTTPAVNDGLAIRIVGSNRLSTVIKVDIPATASSHDAISIGSGIYQPAQWVAIEHLGFIAGSNVPTAGSYINFTGSSARCTLENFFMDSPFVGITVSGQDIHINEGLIQAVGKGLASPGGSGSAGILVVGQSGTVSTPTGPVGYALPDPTISKIEITQAGTTNAPTAGIWVRGCGELRVSGCEISGIGAICLLITGGEAMYIFENFFDNSLYGIYMSATESTAANSGFSPWIARSHFNGNWAGAQTYYGVAFDAASTNPIDSIVFTAQRSDWNGSSGMWIGKGSNIQISNSSFNNNGPYQGDTGYTPGQYGILITSSATTLQVQGVVITGCNCGEVSPAVYSPTATRHDGARYRTIGNENGILLNSAMADYVVIVGCNLTANHSGAIAGSVTHQQIANNLT